MRNRTDTMERMILDSVLLAYTSSELIVEYVWRHNTVARNDLYRKRERLTPFELENLQKEKQQLADRYNYLTGESITNRRFG